MPRSTIVRGISALTAAHWRQMAKDIRDKAGTMHEGQPKQDMLKIAAGYDKLARRIDTLVKEC